MTDFFVHIVMDKKQMRHPRNVAQALRRLASELDEKFGLFDEVSDTRGVIKDLNGSVVGTWNMDKRSNQ